LMSQNGYRLYSFIRKVAIYKDSYSWVLDFSCYY
jgi:hypothetical protein